MDDIRDELAGFIGAVCASAVAYDFDCRNCWSVLWMWVKDGLGLGNVHKPPMQKGMQKRDLVVHAFQLWNAVAARKRIRNMIDAGSEGMYSHR